MEPLVAVEPDPDRHQQRREEVGEPEAERGVVPEVQVARRVEGVLEPDRRNLSEPEDLVRVHRRLPVDREEIAVGNPAQQVVGEQRDDDRQPVLDQAPEGVLVRPAIEKASISPTIQTKIQSWE